MSLPPYIPNYDNFKPGDPVLYSGPYWDHREIDAAKNALDSGAWLTGGEFVARFQNEFSRKFNVKYSHMVNSGSSANLAMIAGLKRRFGWKNGDEIVVSPAGFPTTIAPIVQNGLKPVFVDTEMDTLNFDLNLVEAAITPRTKAIFISPVLGNPPDMDRLAQIVYGEGILLIGDNCDSLGTRWKEHLWTDFCVAHSCSFYPAHHITVGQAGMVSTNDKGLAEIVRSISTWGRDCICVGAANLLPCGTCGKRFSNWLGGDTTVDHRYVFAELGYNLNPALDAQGAIGLEQLKKFDEIDARRKAHFDAIAAMFEEYSDVRVARTEEGASPSWFGCPLICRNRAVKESLVAHFEANKIQTRAMFAGNLLAHPGYRHLGNAADFPKANTVLDTVFFLGCNPAYNHAILTYIDDVLSAWKP